MFIWSQGEPLRCQARGSRQTLWAVDTQTLTQSPLWNGFGPRIRTSYFGFGPLRRTEAFRLSSSTNSPFTLQCNTRVTWKRWTLLKPPFQSVIRRGEIAPNKGFAFSSGALQISARVQINISASGSKWNGKRWSRPDYYLPIDLTLNIVLRVVQLDFTDFRIKATPRTDTARD